MIGWRHFVVAVVAFACLTWSGLAKAQLADLDKGRSAYIARRYADADAIFKQMFAAGAPQDPATLTEARMYWGASLVALSRNDEAAKLFLDLLRDRPDYEPDSTRVEQAAINLFYDTKGKYAAQLNAEEQERQRKLREQQEAERRAREEEQRRRARLELLAAQEQTTIFHSRWIALLPYGVGQFQNDNKTLGWFFLSVEGALTIASVATAGVYLSDLHDRDQAYNTGQGQDQVQHLTDRAANMRYANLIVDGVLALTAIVGVVQAQIEYQPALTQIRQRLLPPLSLVPVVTPLPPAKEGAGPGGFVGIQGRF